MQPVSSTPPSGQAVGKGQPNVISADSFGSMPAVLLSSSLSVGVIHAGFALTGVAETLLGPMLLVLAPHLGLKDTQAGLLFAAQFAGCSLGAFLSRGNLAMRLTTGYALLGVSAALLAVAGAHSALLLFLIFGIGMGMAMTSSSMMIGLRFPLRRGAALSLLNFSWSAGALACPLVVARLLAVRGLETVFFSVAAASLLTCVVALLTVSSTAKAKPDPPGPAPEASNILRPRSGLVIFFALLAFLYVGVEATISGWMATYAHRIASLDLVQAAAVPSFFWGAFLLGRAAASALLLRVPEGLFFRCSLTAAAGGVGLMLLAHSLTTLAIGAVVIGLALAPIFPLTLALFFAREQDPARISWVLGLCSLGGSLLPWLSGLVSGYTGSLRIGLLVPAFALILMLLMSATGDLKPAKYEPRSVDLKLR